MMARARAGRNRGRPCEAYSEVQRRFPPKPGKQTDDDGVVAAQLCTLAGTNAVAGVWRCLD